MPNAKPRSQPRQKKPPRPVEPDDLVRETAGNYVSGDGRFEVRQSDSTWFVVDREQTNEFGQELIHGPFASLKGAKAALPGARDIKPLLRSRPRSKPTAEKRSAPEPPPSWIDRLPRGEAVEVRKLIRALEKEGIDGAEGLVRRDRAGLQPAIAQALLERRVETAINKLPEKDRAVARRVVDSLGEVISSSEASGDPLPGWALFETGPGREPTKRRMRVGS